MYGTYIHEASHTTYVHVHVCVHMTYIHVCAHTYIHTYAYMTCMYAYVCVPGMHTSSDLPNPTKNTT
jgi:hypothetical protein